MRPSLTALIAGLALGLTPLTAAQAEDLLIHGGPIYTGRDDQPQVEALVVRKGDIAYAGPLKAARKLAPEARDIDLAGAAAYPGFVDSHAHLAGIGMRELTLSLEGTPSIEALIVRLKAWVAEHPGKDPVIGRGWIETHWPEKRFPTRQDLDRAVPGRPVILSRADGHAGGVVSRIAMGNRRCSGIGSCGSTIVDDLEAGRTDVVESISPHLEIQGRRG